MYFELNQESSAGNTIIFNVQFLFFYSSYNRFTCIPIPSTKLPHYNIPFSTSAPSVPPCQEPPTYPFVYVYKFDLYSKWHESAINMFKCFELIEFIMFICCYVMLLLFSVVIFMILLIVREGEIFPWFNFFDGFFRFPVVMKKDCT